jgi:hypothetical protein
MAGIPVNPATDAPRALSVRANAFPIAVGFGLGLGATVITAALSQAQGRLFLAVLLSGVGFAYLGSAVADGRPSALAVQAVSITVFLVIAYLGVQLHSGAFARGRLPRPRHVGLRAP